MRFYKKQKNRITNVIFKTCNYEKIWFWLPAIVVSALLASCHDDPEPITGAPVQVGSGSSGGAYRIVNGDTLDLTDEVFYLSREGKVIEFDIYYFGPDTVTPHYEATSLRNALSEKSIRIEYPDEDVSLFVSTYQPEDIAVTLSERGYVDAYSEFWNQKNIKNINPRTPDKLFEICPMHRRRLRIEYLSDNPPVVSTGLVATVSFTTRRWTDILLTSTFEIYSEPMPMI